MASDPVNVPHADLSTHTTSEDVSKISSRVEEKQSDSTSDVEKQGSESEPNDGTFHQLISRKGEQVVVSWTKEEERKVVRKADFLFLPLFTVRTPT